jgi:hypothetical protein
MRFARAAIRRLLTTFLALLMGLAPLHCAWSEALELQQHFKIVAHLQSGHAAPFESSPHDCGNESGCICRGATLAHAVQADHGGSRLTDLLPIDLGLTQLAIGADVTALGNGWNAVADDLFDAPPVSGRQLRALFASLVI